MVEGSIFLRSNRYYHKLETVIGLLGKCLLDTFCYFFIFSYFFKTFPERMNMSGGGGGAGGQPSDHGQQKLESLLFKVSISGYCLSYRTVGRKK